MDNFKSRKNRRQSLDGFVVGKKPSNFNDSLNNFNQYYRPNNGSGGSVPGSVRRIDSFNRNTDGFSPTTQATVSTPSEKGQNLDVMRTFEKEARELGSKRTHTIHKQVEEHSKAKKRLFGRKRRDRSKHSKKLTKKKIALRTSAVFGAIILLIGGGLALRAFLISRGIFKGGGNSALLHNQEVDPSQLKGEGDGRINILVLGKGGEEQHDGPDLTDTIIVASIDPIANEAALLSIPRDFWVKSPSGYQSKINEVYANAKTATLNTYAYRDRNSGDAQDKAEQDGINALKTVVSETMGVPIHYYAMIDFAGFKKAIDTVGGIDVNVTEDMAVRETMWISGRNYYLNVPAGQQHMDGMKALAFSRSRKTSARGDFSRSERQRAVILALKDKIVSTGTLANPVKLNQLMSDFDGQLHTDFSINEMLRLYDLTKQISGDKVASVGLDEYVSGDMINGLSVQVPKAGLFDYTDIQNYVRNVMRDAFLKKEDAKIMILNGTSQVGLATKKSNELKSYGYNIISVGDAPTDTYTDTVLVDLRSGQNKYTLNYLEKRLGVTATGSLPDSTISTGEADFVIILGSNER